MLLVISNQKDVTADYLCRRLKKEGVSYLRFDTDSRVNRFEIKYEKNKPLLKIGSKKYFPSEFNCVWFRRPTEISIKLSKNKSENLHASQEWAESFESFFSFIPREKWINHPSANALARHKLEQLTKAVDVGLLTPDTVLTSDKNTFYSFWKKHKGKVVVKPLASGYLEGKSPEEDFSVFTNRVKKSDLKRIGMLKNCPALFQEMIEKELDVRITVVDKKIEAVGLQYRERDGSQRLDIRRDNMVGVKYMKIVLPKLIRTKIFKLMNFYNLRFSAIDMVIDKSGHWYFLEINPNGQWAWLDLMKACDIGANFISAFKKRN